MKVSARQLNANHPDYKKLDGYIVRHIANIEAQISEAFYRGERSISYGNLEGNFPVSIISNKQAQTYVYGNIIKELIKNEYKASLTVSPTPVLHIDFILDEQKTDDLAEIIKRSLRH